MSKQDGIHLLWLDLNNPNAFIVTRLSHFDTAFKFSWCFAIIFCCKVALVGCIVWLKGERDN